MNASLRTPLKFDIRGLIQAIAHNQGQDSFSPHLSSAQWDVLASYMQPCALTQGQVLIQQGSPDRTLYLVESGTLTVHYEDKKGRLRLAIVEAGSAVGEGTFFSRRPRTATVQAAAPCKIWSLAPIRFSELSNRNPPMALELAMALGALLSRRLVNKPKRVAVT